MCNPLNLGPDFIERLRHQPEFHLVSIHKTILLAVLLTSILPMGSRAQKYSEAPLSYTVSVLSSTESETVLQLNLKGRLPEGQFVFSGKNTTLNSSLGPQLKVNPDTDCLSTGLLEETGTSTESPTGNIKGWKLEGDITLNQQVTVKKKCIFAGVKARFVYNWYDGKYLKTVILFLDVPDMALEGMRTER